MKDYGSYKETIAVLVRVGVMGINQEKNNMPTYCQQYGLTPIETSGDRNIKTAHNLAEAIHGMV